MKIKKFSKVLAFILLLCMMFYVCPMVAFAMDASVSSEAELNAAISAATGTETNPTIIDISSDFTIQSAINVPADKCVVINGNNHTISRAHDSTNYVTSGKLTVGTHAMFYIEGYAKIVNLTIDAKGDETHLLRAFVVDGGTADVYLGDGKITGAYSTTSAGGALVAIDGTVNFYSGELSNNTATCGAALLSDKAGTINMCGGKVVTNNSNLTLGDGITAYGYNNSRINLLGGSIENNTSKKAVIYQVFTQLYAISGDFVISGNKNGEGILSDIFLGIGSPGYRNIIDGKDYTKANAAIALTSALKTDLYFSTSDDSSWTTMNRRTLLEGANDYTITESDLEKVHLTWNGTDITNDDNYFKTVIDNRIEFFKKVIITYDANYEGSTDTTTQATGYGAKTTLNANTFRRNGFGFVEWNTKADGTGDAYANRAVAETPFSFREDTTLYAQWEPCTHDAKTYTADGSVLIQSCLDCGKRFGTATITPSENLIYDGSKKEATVTISEDWIGAAVPSIEYYNNENKLNDAPTDAGIYTAKITMEGATASIEFTIVKVNQSVSYENNEVTKHINDGTFTNELTKNKVNGKITYSSSDPAVAIVDENGEVTIVGAGIATITANATETVNYNPAMAEYTLTVTNHSYTDMVTVPTCTEKGYTIHTCSECGDTYKDTYVDATGHSYDDSWKLDKNGHWQECTDCNKKSDIVAHTFQWNIDKDATETEKGAKHEECSICHFKKDSIEIPVIGGTKKPGDNTSSVDTKNPSNQDKKSLQTGDSNNMMRWIFQLVVSVAAIGATLALLKKWSDCKKI